MKKTLLISLLFLAFNINSTENSETIDILTVKICDRSTDEHKCKETIQAIILLSIYDGYASSICGNTAGSQVKFDSDCIKAQKDVTNTVTKIKQKYFSNASLQQNFDF